MGGSVQSRTLGRGDGLLSHGDIESNPGPTDVPESIPDVGCVPRSRAGLAPVTACTDSSPGAEWMRRNRASEFLQLVSDPGEATMTNPPDTSSRAGWISPRRQGESTQDYALCAHDVRRVCAHFGVHPTRDCFASALNAKFVPYWTEDDDAFAQNWRTEACCWMNPPWERMEDAVGKLEAECPEAILIAPAFTNTRWLEKMMVSGASSVKLRWNFGLFRKCGTDAMEAPRRDVWAFHLKRREEKDVPLNNSLASQQGDPVA